GAWRAARGDLDRAMHYYASGYYYVAKQQRLDRSRQAAVVPASAPPKANAKPLALVAKPKENTRENTRQAAIADAKPALTAAKPKPVSRKLTAARAQVSRPPATIPNGANDAKPR